MFVSHTWNKLKFGNVIGVGATDCKQCGLVLLPNLQKGFSCKNCSFIIHQKCLVKGKGIDPCTHIEYEKLEQNTIFSGLYEKEINIPKVSRDRKAANKAMSKSKGYWFTLTKYGVLYYSNIKKKQKQKGAFFIQDYEITKREKDICFIKRYSQKTDPIIIKEINTEYPIDKLYKLITESSQIKDLYVSNIGNLTSGWFNLLSVKVSEGKNFPAMDISGTSDCYCILACEYEYGRTQTIWKNNKNPFWAESFDFDIIDPESAVLTVYVLDEDILQTDDVIGVVKITDLQTLSPKPEAKWYPVKKCIHFATGFLRLRIIVTENELHVVLVEGKNLPSADPNGKSDPYVRLELDGQKKKSKTVKKTLNPVFNESFVFNIKSKSSKILNILVYDWDRLVSDDFLGKITIDFKDYPLDETVEESYLLTIRETEEQVKQFEKKYEGANLGELKLVTSMIRRAVHPMGTYYSLLDLLLTPGIPSIFLVSKAVVEKGPFASILVKIFDTQSKTVYLANQLTDHEIDCTPNPDIIFRGNTIVTKTMDSLMKLAGKTYMETVLGPILVNACQKKSKALEIDPLRVDKSQISKNSKALRTLCQSLLDRIFDSVEECPPLMCVLFYNIRSKVEQTYNPEQIEIVKYTSVSAFTFLRFFCPVIINPKLFGLIDKLSNASSRTCTLLAKLVQNLANIVHFGEKEPYMKEFNDLIDLNIPRMKLFIDKLCERGNNFKVSNFEQLNPDTWIEKELAMCAIHLRKSQKKWEDPENLTSQSLVSILDNIEEMDKKVGDTSMQ